MSKDIIQKYRDILKDDSHEFNSAAWLLFAKNVSKKRLTKKLTPKRELVLPYIMEIISTDAFYHPKELGAGYAPKNAIYLVGVWQITEATPILLRCLEQDNFNQNTYAYESCIYALYEMGTSVQDEVLAFIEKHKHNLLAQVCIIELIPNNLQGHPAGIEFLVNWCTVLHQAKRLDETVIEFYLTCLIECDLETGRALYKNYKKGYSKDLKSRLERVIRYMDTGEWSLLNPEKD